MKRVAFAVSLCVMGLLPPPAHPVSNSRQEFLQALRSTPSMDRGAELFDTCAACHGSSGAGTRDGAIPRIAGQHHPVVAKQLVDYRNDRRWDPRMEHFADQHHLADAQAIRDVAEYIQHLEISSPPGVGTGELVEHGRSVYADRCQSCHGIAGEGDAKTLVPRIAGQHYEYLRRQFYDAVEGRRPNFSPRHVRLFAGLERDDIVGLADYLSRMTAVSNAQPMPQGAGR